MRSDSRSDELTIKEAALVVGGASALAARRRVERALEQHQLPWHWGLVGGRRLKMVYREDLVVWRSTLVEPAEAEVHDDKGRDDRDDDDDTHDDDDRPAPGGALDEAQERVGAMLRDVQSGAIAEVGRQMQAVVVPLLDDLKGAYERIGRSDAEGAMWRERAERAERALAAQETARRHDDDAGDDDPNAERQTPNAKGAQRRPWWRFWARG